MTSVGASRSAMMREMTSAAQQRVRELCMAMPQTQERLSHGEPTWFAGGKRVFVTSADRHHDDRVAFWAAAPEGAQGRLVADDPEHYFVPPYVGGRGWVGVYLDVPGLDWDRIEEILEDAFRQVAKKALIAELDETGQAERQA